ncbi:MAG TPA: S1 RNA-binding domain-containing protein [Phycisphaerae bacterium]|nr:S1 RNA-binding domain-containing protein [Phycisphaerae bacterium]HOJ76035.1 S1 RNA-binding domain-containing protein [Phycisphaerae bacterium]HOM53076.1 S1 RNA-binding domain-containing protein [Phycisphaerae bacterium]HOQ86097.1 S1 RNA-binding domain-containing protein [Phycisphaerae bacterium]HPP25837.1 S1 RNA-binding domain-containing protein [Phycisphaerae bacterium]
MSNVPNSGIPEEQASAAAHPSEPAGMDRPSEPAPATEPQAFPEAGPTEQPGNAPEQMPAGEPATVAESGAQTDPASSGQDITTDQVVAAEEATAPAAPPAPRPVVTTGKVQRVTASEILIEVEGGKQGAVPIEEFLGQPLPRPGDEVGVIIVRDETETGGGLVLSKRQADEASFWDSVKPGDIIEGVVTGMNKGGLDIDIGGARAFLPASQVDVRRIKDISVLIGEHVRCVVTQVDPTTRDLIVSRRKVIDKERREKRAEALNALVEGELRKGTVSSITEFGAFVDVGGVEGLLHVTDMTWGRVRNPNELVQPGQELEVRVLKVDRNTGKVSLGLKQAKPDPWADVETKYPAGSRVKGRILRFADFGAFVELEDGVEALLPISEMSWSKRINHPSEVLELGREIETVVLRADASKRRISLGLKQMEENPWDVVERQCPVNSTVKGKVSKIMEFGAFVELVPGVEGLVHISELSERRVRSVSDVVKEGQEVEVRVLKIDRNAQRISLSMKPAPKEEPPKPEEKPKPKKKRPLRGGLSSHFEW